ncbi:MAG: phage holin family protein, partial [Lachnospiraceae bacterium]|nr:phage holin family protein [Lachnospiraceae bacterium]
MERKIPVNTIKGIAVMTCTVIGNELEMISPALILLLLLMITDYTSGMLASKKEAVEHPNSKKYGWSSKKSIIGIYKKAGYILTILVAVSMDYIVYDLLREMGIEYRVKTFFGFLVTIWLTINELLSIMENAGRLGVEIPQ